MVTPGESSAQGFHELFMKYWHVTPGRKLPAEV